LGGRVFDSLGLEIDIDKRAEGYIKELQEYVEKYSKAHEDVWELDWDSGFEEVLRFLRGQTK